MSLLLHNLDQSLQHADIDPRDQAGVELARQLALQIDNDSERLGSLAPKLLATLTALGLTPAGRKHVKAPEPADDEGDAALAEVRQLRSVS